MVTSIGYQLQKNRRITSFGFHPRRLAGTLVRHGGTALVNRVADLISGDGWKLTGMGRRRRHTVARRRPVRRTRSVIYVQRPVRRRRRVRRAPALAPALALPAPAVAQAVTEALTGTGRRRRRRAHTTTARRHINALRGLVRRRPAVRRRRRTGHGYYI